MSKRKRRISNAKKNAEKRKKGSGSTTVAIPENVNKFEVKKEGAIRIDVVPYEIPEGFEYPLLQNELQPGDLHYERRYYVHINVGPNNKWVVCPQKTFGHPCPICEHMRELQKEGKLDDDMRREYFPRERQLWNIIDLDNKEDGVQIWDVSYHLFGRTLDAMIEDSEDEDGFHLFHDPDDGMSLKVGIEEKNLFGSTFYNAKSIIFRPRKEPLSDEILDAAVVLDKCILETGYDEIKALFFGDLSEDDEDEDDDDDSQEEEKEEVEGKKEKSVKVQEEEQEEEQEEKPKPKRRGRPPKVKKEEPPKKKEDPKASDFGIEKGDTVEYKGNNCEVIKISPDGTSLTLVDEENEDVIRAVSPADVKKMEVDNDSDDSDSEDEDDWDDDWEKEDD